HAASTKTLYERLPAAFLEASPGSSPLEAITYLIQDVGAFRQSCFLHSAKIFCLFSTYGTCITHFRVAFRHLFPRNPADGVHGRQDHASSARPVWIIYDVPGNTDAKHDDVLLYRDRQTGEGPGGQPSRRPAARPAHENL